jgi:argininosuccinate synthase
VSGLVAVAFSGGLDTSWCIPWIKFQGHEVMAVTVDVGGHGPESAAALEERALTLGASKFVLVDARATFFDEVLRYLLAGNVLRGATYPLSVGAERAVQAREAARAAKEAGAVAIAHGCTAAGNDQVRFEVALRTFAPDLQRLAPVRDTSPSRAEQVALLERLGLPVPPHGARYSVNEGLWGVTIGGAETLGTTESIPEGAWQWTKGAFDSPQATEPLTIQFEAGVPVSVGGRETSPVEAIQAVNETGSKFGIGRGIHLGETVLGVKGRVAFEAPGATLLISAHRELEKLVLTGRQIAAKDAMARLYGDWVHEGQWTDPAARDIEALLRSSQQRVTGQVTLELNPGRFLVTGVQSPFSLHAASKAVYGESSSEWTAEDAKGFARMVSVPSELAARAGAGG